MNVEFYSPETYPKDKKGSHRVVAVLEGPNAPESFSFGKSCSSVLMLRTALGKHARNQIHAFVWDTEKMYGPSVDGLEDTVVVVSNAYYGPALAAAIEACPLGYPSFGDPQNEAFKDDPIYQATTKGFYWFSSYG
jgi:hypothetical protein